MSGTYSWSGPSGADRQRGSAALPNGFGQTGAGSRGGRYADPYDDRYPDHYDDRQDDPHDESDNPQGAAARGVYAADGPEARDGMDESGEVFAPEDDDVTWDGPADFDEACANGQTPGGTSVGLEDDEGKSSGKRVRKPYCDVDEEEYRRTELTRPEMDWFMSLGALDIADDLDSCVEALFNAPKSLRHSADYGFLGGLAVGRLLALDHFGKPHVKELLERVYGLVEPWTVFNPSAAGFLLATFSPQVVYTLILFWPEEYAPYRTFYAAALMGLYLERMPGTDFLHGEAASNLCSIIESQRREGSPGLL